MDIQYDNNDKRRVDNKEDMLKKTTEEFLANMEKWGLLDVEEP